MASSSLFGFCSTVMLLLLIQLYHVSSVNNCSLHTFNVDVDEFGKHVKNCSNNCSLVPDNDVKCKCLNLSISDYDVSCNCLNFRKSNYTCEFPGYFTEALYSLDRSFKRNHRTRTQSLLKSFRYLNQTCKVMDFCPFNMKYERVLSPRLLHAKLEALKQQLNAKISM